MCLATPYRVSDFPPPLSVVATLSLRYIIFLSGSYHCMFYMFYAILRAVETHMEDRTMNYRIIVKLPDATHPVKVSTCLLSTTQSNIEYYISMGYTLIAVQEKINGEWITIEGA